MPRWPTTTPRATNEDTPVVINVLANDTDSDGNINPTSVAITASRVTAPCRPMSVDRSDHLHASAQLLRLRHFPLLRVTDNGGRLSNIATVLGHGESGERCADSCQRHVRSARRRYADRSRGQGIVSQRQRCRWRRIHGSPARRSRSRCTDTQCRWFLQLYSGGELLWPR